MTFCCIKQSIFSISLLLILFGTSVELNAQLVESGVDDQRVSQNGPDGDNTYDAFGPKVAFNETTLQYLIVWSGDDDFGTQVEGESEIFAQLFDNKGPIGEQIRISQMGPDGNRNFDASAPAVAYNNRQNEFMVVWHADHNDDGLLDNEFEIFGQRINGSGALIGLPLRISDMGTVGDDTYDANSPEIVYNSIEDEYLVVWSSDEVLDSMVNNEFEIFGQLLDSVGNEIGVNDFRISDNGPEGEHSTDAVSPSVAYNSINNEYLVVWEGNLDPIPPFSNLCDHEIFGQILNAHGSEIGTNDFRISFNFSQDGNCSYDVAAPHVAFNADLNQYFVVWQGQDEEVIQNEIIFQLAKEVYGMLLDDKGILLLPNDIRLTDVGGDDPQNSGEELEAGRPVVVYNSNEKEYVIIFEADENIDNQINREFEIFIQRVDDKGIQIGLNDKRISALGGLGNAALDAGVPFLAYDPNNNEYLTVFQGDSNEAPIVDNEFEIFAQLLTYAEPTINNDCSQSSINVTSILINQSDDTDYRVTQSLTSNATLGSRYSSFLFQAPEDVGFNSGFTVEAGVRLLVHLSNCVSK